MEKKIFKTDSLMNPELKKFIEEKKKEGKAIRFGLITANEDALSCGCCCGCSGDFEDFAYDVSSKYKETGEIPTQEEILGVQLGESYEVSRINEVFAMNSEEEENTVDIIIDLEFTEMIQS